MAKDKQDPIILSPVSDVTSRHQIVTETEGTKHDRFQNTYSLYINERFKNPTQARTFLKDLKLQAIDLAKALEKLGTVLLEKFPFAAPSINRSLRERIDMSVEQAESQLAIRYLNYTQLIQQPWYRTCLKDKLEAEDVAALIQQLYEMIRLVKDIVELIEVIDPDPRTGLIVQ